MSFEFREAFTQVPETAQQEHEVTMQLDHQSAIRCAREENTFSTIKRRLEDENLLENEVELVQQLFKEELKQEIWMTELDWERLAVMNAHDEKTARHCVRTVVLARQKMDECIISGKKLKEHVLNDETTLTSFYRACLFHDVGKCCLPHELLNLPLTDMEIAERLHSYISTTEEGAETLRKIEAERCVNYIGETEEDLKAFLAKAHPIRYAPAYLVLSEEQVANFMSRFPEIDFSKITVMELIGLHEKESGRVLEEEGDPAAAKVAAAHHHRDGTTASKFLGLTVAAEEYLSLVDMYEAFTSPDRVYRKKSSKLEALSQLIQEVKLKGIDKVLAISWITSELQKIDTAILFPGEKEHYEMILEYIAS